MKNPIVEQALRVMNEEDGSRDAYDCAALAAWHGLNGGQKEVLRQLLFNGPVWDGDICSKAARGDLFDWSLAVRCCFKGEQGYTAAAYRAYTIWKAGNPEPEMVPRPSIQEVTDILRPMGNAHG